MHIAQVMDGMHLHVRTCARADELPLSYLGNGWTDSAEIWCVIRNQLSKRFAQVKSGVHLHVSTCIPLFHFSGTAGWIALKFHVWLETH